MAFSQIYNEDPEETSQKWDTKNLQCGDEVRDDEFKVSDKVTWAKQLC